MLAVVIATAGFTFDRLDAVGAMVPATPVAGAATESCGPAFPCFNAAVYGADVVLPIIDFGQDSEWRPDSSARWGTFAVWFPWISIALGWLLASIFVAAFTSLVRRD